MARYPGFIKIDLNKADNRAYAIARYIVRELNRLANEAEGEGARVRFPRLTEYVPADIGRSERSVFPWYETSEVAEGLKGSAITAWVVDGPGVAEVEVDAVNDDMDLHEALGTGGAGMSDRKVVRTVEMWGRPVAAIFKVCPGFETCPECSFAGLLMALLARTIRFEDRDIFFAGHRLCEAQAAVIREDLPRFLEAMEEWLGFVRELAEAGEDLGLGHRPKVCLF